jgi:hypothetical protein
LRALLARAALLCCLYSVSSAAQTPAPEPARAEPSGYTMSCRIRRVTDLPEVRLCAELGAAQRCAHEAELASHGSQDVAVMTIGNRSVQAIRIYWLGFSGTRRLYQTIAPGNQVVQSTFLGHNWLVTTEDGRCIGIFNAAPMSLAFF